MDIKPIRAFTRGLLLLEALNRHGSASAVSLARETGLPRATVLRLLQTLAEQGYVGRAEADNRYHLRLRVRSLSEGFHGEQWIAAIAGPAIVELTRRTSWPSDISMLDGMEMVIHETTHRIAPLSIDRNMVGQRMPLLASSSGLAYLAFAPLAERETLLAMLARSEDPRDALARDAKQIGRLLAMTRRQGYGLRQGGAIWPHTGAIAVPIRAGSRLLGCINIVWMSRAITAGEGVSRCLGPLMAARDAIEAGLAGPSEGRNGEA